VLRVFSALILMELMVKFLEMEEIGNPAQEGFSVSALYASRNRECLRAVLALSSCRLRTTAAPWWRGASRAGKGGRGTRCLITALLRLSSVRAGGGSLLALNTPVLCEEIEHHAA
jgi:hypothetical protein